MGAPYVDGLYPSGAPIITMTGGATFKCNRIEFQKGAETHNITDPDGKHAGAIQFQGPRTGTAEVQFANVNVAEPTTAAQNVNMGTFVANIDGANANIFVTSVDIKKPQRENWTATLGLQVKEN